MGSVEVKTTEGDGETRETLIKSHFSQRIAELTNELQMADSRAVHYNAEVRIFGALKNDKKNHGSILRPERQINFRNCFPKRSA